MAVGNWGRWGNDDERGALNLLTPEVVSAAAASIRTGKVYSLGIPIQAKGVPLMDYRGTPWPWIGMPRLYTLPVVMEAAPAFTTSGVRWLSAPRSSSSPQRPQLLARSVIPSSASVVMSFPPEHASAPAP